MKLKGRTTSTSSCSLHLSTSTNNINFRTILLTKEKILNKYIQPGLEKQNLPKRCSLTYLRLKKTELFHRNNQYSFPSSEPHHHKRKSK